MTTKQHAEKPTRTRDGEKPVADDLLGDFIAEGSKGDKLLNDFFGKKVTVNRAVSLAFVLSKLTGLPFPRNYTRRKDLTILWFNNNYDKIIPFLPYVKFDEIKE